MKLIILHVTRHSDIQHICLIILTGSVLPTCVIMVPTNQIAILETLITQRKNDRKKIYHYSFLLNFLENGLGLFGFDFNFDFSSTKITSKCIKKNFFDFFFRFPVFTHTLIFCMNIHHLKPQINAYFFKPVRLRPNMPKVLGNNISKTDLMHMIIHVRIKK